MTTIVSFSMVANYYWNILNMILYNIREYVRKKYSAHPVHMNPNNVSGCR